MAIKFKVDSVDGLDESVASMYSKHEDGSYYLDVEGAVSKDKLDEFRSNNIKLLKQLESFKDVDVDKYNDLLQKQIEMDKKKMIPVTKVDEMVLERVKTMQDDFEKDRTKLQEENGLLNRQLESLLIDSTVRREATSTKALDTAVEDILLRAKSVFKVVDGVAVPHDSKGEVVYGKNGKDPMSVNEWLTGLTKSAPHLFQASQGTGSRSRVNSFGSNDPSKMSSVEKIKAGLESR